MNTYIAQAVLNQLTTGHLPDPNTAGLLDRIPAIEILRNNVNEHHLPMLLDVLNKNDGQLAGLGCSLLRNYSNTPCVREAWTHRWTSADPHLKNRLMWRLMDSVDLTPSQHQQFYDFIMQNPSPFVLFNREFFGSSSEGLVRILSRLGDARIPSTKKWIYLCCFPDIVDNLNALRTLLSVGLAIDDPFTHIVADDLLQRLQTGDLSHLTLLHEKETCNKYSDPWNNHFVASATLESLRAGNRPDEAEAAEMNSIPFIDALRDAIKESDIPWIIEGINIESGELAGLYLSLLRNFTGYPDVQGNLKKRWNSTNISFLKAHLIWRILDDPTLSPEWHRMLFDFVNTEQPTFKKVCLNFFGPSENVMENAHRRITDPTIAASKKWIHLCRVAAVATDRNEAVDFIQREAHNLDPFAQEVAAKLVG